MANLYLSTPSMLISTNVKSPDWPEQKGKVDPFPTKTNDHIQLVRVYHLFGKIKTYSYEKY